MQPLQKLSEQPTVSEVEEAVKFIENFDKFFDCLNVINKL